MSDEQPTSRLMALPAELRNWIYDVSRQIRREASSMFWAAKAFAFQVEEEDELINALKFFDAVEHKNVLSIRKVMVYFYYPDEEPYSRIDIDTSKVWEFDACPYYEKVIENDDFGDGEPNEEARWKQTEYLDDTFAQLIGHESDGSIDAEGWKKVLRAIYEGKEYQKMETPRYFAGFRTVANTLSHAFNIIRQHVLRWLI
ncbi:hypothetical protein LTR37_005642 [Vermiconidia calcicola]|uniref:Uncharacterized protein n=1 Tax=Vermiconidia calcicola TaxID=1690605 RepID=A0ACC3NIR4_9PEZI|nr:hypothetical protein LTR37_005642 [Vermiconidia calcicola]